MPFFTYRSTNFTLDIDSQPKFINIAMQMLTPVVTTRNLPRTLTLLERYFPAVLSTECFNDDHLTFREEVLSTETGHLFEHILLESLCRQKIRSGRKNVVFNGRTSWNWNLSPRGKFDIWVDAKSSDLPHLLPALDKSIKLTELILASGQTSPRTILRA